MYENFHDTFNILRVNSKIIKVFTLVSLIGNFSALASIISGMTVTLLSFYLNMFFDPLY